MSITRGDLEDIRQIIREEIRPLSGKLEALRNGVKEIYGMISGLEKTDII